MTNSSEIIKDVSFNLSAKLDPEMQYLRADGNRYCRNCNTPTGVWHEGKFYAMLCKCVSEKIRAAEKAEELKEEQKRFREAQTMSLLGKRFADCTFENTKENDGNFNEVLSRVKKYVDGAEMRLKRGHGFYIYGESGTGKSHISACVGNYLMMKGYKVLFTNFITIAGKIKETYKSRTFLSEIDVVEQIAGYDFLIIDDFGTEQFKKASDDTFYQEKVYDILNKRCNLMKPTMFTSNLSLQELIDKKGVMKKTVERVLEMSTVRIKLECSNFRHKKAREKADF